MAWLRYQTGSSFAAFPFRALGRVSLTCQGWAKGGTSGDFRQVLMAPWNANFQTRLRVHFLFLIRNVLVPWSNLEEDAFRVLQAQGSAVRGHTHYRLPLHRLVAALCQLVSRSCCTSSAVPAIGIFNVDASLLTIAAMRCREFSGSSFFRALLPSPVPCWLVLPSSNKRPPVDTERVINSQAL